MSESQKTAKILIIDDDAEIRYSLGRVLSSRSFEITEAGSGEEGIEIAGDLKPDIIFLDNRMGGMSGIETLQHLMGIDRRFLVIMMTAYGTTQTAIEAMKFGAFDYIIKPFDIAKVLQRVDAALEVKVDRESTEEYTPLLDHKDYKEGIVGSSEPMQEVFKQIGQIAATDVTVLITGESGTGKELIAKAIYQHSLRSSGPYIAVNCAAIPENLIESELFGHEKGAFTGATQMRKGKFELCDGGTIFLDEIGDMALPTQTKILRVLQEGEIQRVGGSATIKVDVRLIAATNKPLEKMVQEKTFREDLYYRLNVARIRLPALRERRDDIPELIDYMLQSIAKHGQSHVNRVSSDAKSLLTSYPWPGNVRELENVVQRAAVIAQNDTIVMKDLPGEVLEWAKTNEVVVPSKEGFTETTGTENESGEVAAAAEVASAETMPPVVADLDSTFDQLYRLLRDEVDTSILAFIERQMIKRVLEESSGNQVKSSNILGITRATLRKRIEQYADEEES